MRISLAVLAILVAATAHADDLVDDLRVEVEQLFGHDTEARFAFINDGFYVGKPKYQRVTHPSPGGIGEQTAARNVVAVASGDAAWVATDISLDCVKHAPDCVPDDAPTVHFTGLVQRDGKGWKWIALHAGTIVSAKDQAKRKPPAALPGDNKGAEEIVKRFTTTMADPKALATSVSRRKDVVLYGSGVDERVVGAAKVKAKLAKWGFAFKPRDGIHAGIVGTVAWVAANVDATKAGKSSPYRVLAIYEKSGGEWQLVQVQFSN